MRNEDLDRMLSEKDEIVPSSGFLPGVMEAIQRQAIEPPPIPFPWKRALPGLAAALFILALSFVAGSGIFHNAPQAELFPGVLPSIPASLIQVLDRIRLGWIALALAASFISVKLSTLLALRKSRT